MPYSDRDYKVSNVNYLNKDFNALKSTLIEYAKTYFPNSYRDFNETSPGMMLLEMNAYVGDVLSFYIDQQYREMLLPLAEERRNIITMAKMFGYKVKPIVPAYVDLTFQSNVNATFNVLQAAQRNEVNRFIYTASSSCYGIPKIYPTPETAGPGSAVIFVVFQDTSPVEPKPDAVPEFDIVTPAGIVIVSPLSPNCVVPQFVLGLILFTFISLIIYLLKFIPYYYNSAT